MMRFPAGRMVLLALYLLIAREMRAQTESPADDDSTLHVYVNLVQIPVLVLNQSLHPVARIPDHDFRVELEGAGHIHPTRIRMQGDDPINLVLIVDRSVQDDSIWDELPKSLNPLVASLQVQDKISVLATDGCTARRIGTEMAPFHEDSLRLMMKTVVDMRPYKFDRHRKDGCPKPIGYWDMVTYAASTLPQYQGRKLIVTLGPGSSLDGASAARVHKLLTDSSITLFPIIHASFDRGGMNPYAGSQQMRSFNQMQDASATNPGIDTDAAMAMNRQAELSGGLLLGTSQRAFAKTLAEPITLARGRYIIEFPRPDTLPPGLHHIMVADGHPRDFIRPAGISVPMADAKEKRTLVMADDPPAVSAPVGNEGVAAHGPDISTGTGTHLAAPATRPAPAATPSDEPTAAVSGKPASVKTPEPDPTDITGDLRPSH